MTWVLSAEAISRIIPTLGLIIVVSLVLFFTILITRRLTKESYEVILENRLNETADNIVRKYKAKLEEIEVLKEKLKTQRITKKQAMKILSDLLSKLSE